LDASSQAGEHADKDDTETGHAEAYNTDVEFDR
jgi:hypothetical protein